MKKSLTRLLVAILFVFSISLLITNATQAKPKLNKITKVMIKGNKYTLKIKGVKNRNLKAVTFKTSNKKVISVKKKSKNKAVLTAKKNGKATIKAVIRYKKKVKGKKKVTLKCKITVKSIKKKESTGNNVTDVPWEDTTNSIDYNGKWEDIVKQINTSKNEEITKVTDSILKYDEETGEVSYGFITSPFWRDIDWYNEKQYNEIVAELKRIVEVTHISEEMTDQEKAYRLGRYLSINIDYYLPTHEQTIYGTLFNKKTVCGGYAHTYATLCRYVGIECDYMYTEGLTDNHAWNIVKLGEYWYSVDMTRAEAQVKSVKWLPEELKYISVDCVYFRTIYEEQGNSKYYKNVAPCYRTKQYMSTHPLDTMCYSDRCEREGISYLTDLQLYKLPE